MIPGISSLTIFSKYSCKLALNTNFRSFRVLLYKKHKLLYFPSNLYTIKGKHKHLQINFFYNSSLKPPPIFLKEFAVSSTVCKMPFAEDKEKYLQMSLDEKRSMYRCKEKFVTLEKIPSWTKYSEDVKLTNSSDEAAYPVNKAFNDKISIFDGDITALEIDAIVNAANKSLRGGGGVDGAIHQAAGSALYEECLTLNGCPTGEAKITGGYKLPAKYVIHTVGPVGENPNRLRSCYDNSLELMRENSLRSIAFPCISTGVYKYPNKQAAHVALKTVREFLERHGDSVDRVIFCLFLHTDVEFYEALTQVYFPL